MDQLHEAKIKVLRERQERKLQDSITSTEQELDDLINHHAKEMEDLQHLHRQEEASLIRALDAKKSALLHRWYLEEAILRKKLELRHGQPYGPLPVLSFSSPSSTVCVTPRDSDQSTIESKPVPARDEDGNGVDDQQEQREEKKGKST